MKNLYLTFLCSVPAVLIPALLTLVSAAEATASAQVVTNSADSGPGTLRSAITNAANGAVITFASSLSGATINLSNNPLPINTNLTLDASALTGGIQINGHGLIFDVASNITVFLNSLTLLNGFGGAGGAIYNGGTLTLANCTLSGNYAVDEGGGIYNVGTLTLTNCTLSGNNAEFGGGGIWNSAGTLALTNCTLTGNMADSGYAPDGGGIYNDGTLMLNACSLSGNFASGYGDGIANYGTLTLNQCTLSSNGVLSAIDYSGSIYNDGTLTLTDCILSGNTGGGIDSEGGTVTLVQCTLSGNSGGIVNSGTLTLNQCTLTGNSANNDNGGGGVYNDGTLTLTNCILSGNTDSGIVTDDGTVTLVQCTLLGNSAGNGGGILVLDEVSTVTLNQCTLSGNSSSGSGGGVENIFGRLTLNQCTLSGNDAGADGDGGGIANYGTLTLNECTLSGNGAGVEGGGIYNNSHGSLAAVEITNTIVVGNNAGSGADIFNFEGALAYGGSNLVQLVDNNGGSATGPTPLTSAPDLAALGNYGGPTQTMPPLPGSPAIGAGCVAANTFAADQRGYPRTKNGLIDLGAVELPTVPPFTASPTNDWQSNPLQFSSTNVDSDGSAILQWNWSFGDHTTGAAQNPPHGYAAIGTFSPSLIVTNSLGLALAVTGPSITVLPPLTLTGLSFSGTNLVLNGANGASGLTFTVLVSTNPALPMSIWSPLMTNTWNANGAFSLTVTNTLNASVPNLFFLLEAP